MRQRDYLTDFEQLVMLAVLQLGEDAYGAPIRRALEEQADRAVSIATIYVSLGRLEERDLVRSWFAAPTKVRGGRSKRLYAVTEPGLAALERSRAHLEQMWEQARAAISRGSR